MGTVSPSNLANFWVCQFRNNIFCGIVGMKKISGFQNPHQTADRKQVLFGKTLKVVLPHGPEKKCIFRPVKYMFTKKQVSHIAVRRQVHTAPWLQECF